MSSAAAPRCDRTLAWASLAGHFEAHGRELDLREAFRRDAQRFASLSWQAPEVFLDASRSHIDVATVRWLVAMAQECQLEARRDQMLGGAVVNRTEGRRALHTALRATDGKGLVPPDVQAQVQTQLHEMLAFAETLRRDATIRHVVNIGIGGSDLGPQLVTQALGVRGTHLQVHFVSNIDGQDLMQTLAPLTAQETVFIVSSKTFTTQETLANARLAKAWFEGQGGHDVARHFVAVSANPKAASEFGISRCFAFWDWVGGRFSLWSSIGLPIVLALGASGFLALLAGARAMDEHFANEPLERNVPTLLGLLDVWYRNFHHYTSRCVVPYAHGLRRLPAYLQQLMMESNGKSVDMAGQALPFATSDVVWGEPGTNAQHAFFQMLHQGSDVVPVEFILVRQPEIDPSWREPVQHAVREQHRALLANALAQAQALMVGRDPSAALQDNPAAPIDAQVLARHRSFAGNRPSLTLMLEQLNPHALGAMIALYEHRVFVSGALWGINSFDQWGVELGKAMGRDLLARLHSGQTLDLDGTAAAWVNKLR